MKKISLFVFVLFAVSMVQAQTPFKKGDKVINVGVGFGTYGVSGSTTIPPLSVSFDYGFKNQLFDAKSSLSFGGYAGYYSSKSTFTNPTYGTYGWNFSNILIGGRAAVHYDFVEKLDTYAGLMLGYNVASANYYGDKDLNINQTAGGGFLPALFIGARYYFTNNLAAFGEIGYGISAIELGVAYKL